eukprot:SAG22_NODE_4911_length_1120_cov_1.913043_1_plen_175_part_10
MRYQKLVLSKTQQGATFPLVLAVLEPSSDSSSFAGDEACCAVCLSLPFQPRRYDCPRKHLLCEACTVAWQEFAAQRTGACPACPPELLPPNPDAPVHDKNASQSLQATLISCPATGAPVRLKELRKHLQKLGAGLLVPGALLTYGTSCGDEPAAAEEDGSADAADGPLVLPPLVP